MKYILLGSPVGDILVTASDAGIHHILFDDMPAARRILLDGIAEKDAHDALLLRVKTQLAEYFTGSRSKFDLPLAGNGTVFQQKVWSVLQIIPYAETRHYGQLAELLGQPTASRAVGMANGKNPLSIVVPCHRVIGKNRSLTGYAGGLERKAWLLAHEARYCRA